MVGGRSRRSTVARGNGRFPAPRRGRGFVLLAILALLLLVGAGSLLTHLQWAEERARVARDRITGEALAQAKAALVAYAVTNPNAPGRMPYPDRGSDGNYDGDSDCINTGTTVLASHLLGRLPLNGEIQLTSGCASEASWSLAGDYRDGDGERLWYAVSPYLLFNGASYGGLAGTGINTGLLDTPAGSPWLTVHAADGSVISNRVAMVIIAPGNALPGQSRAGATPAASQYLDSVTVGGTTYSNADGDLDFIVYPNSDTTAAGGDAFNDRLVYVTAEELMPKVESRVLGDVAGVLNDYRSSYGRYPWLSPVATSLASSDFTGVPGTRAGYMPYIDVAAPEVYTFDTGMTVSWTRGNAAVDHTDLSSGLAGSLSVVLFVLANPMDAKNQEAFDALNSVSVPMPTAPGGGAQCDWNGDPDAVDCEYSTTGPAGYPPVTVCALRLVPLPPIGSCAVLAPLPVSRTIDVSLHYDSGAMSLPSPSGSGARERDVDSGATLSTPTATTVTVTDFVTTPAFTFLGIDLDPLVLSVSRKLRAQDGDTARFLTTGLYYEPRSGAGIATGTGDLPAWFAEQQWGPYVYLTYASSYQPTMTGDCTAGTDCLSVNLDGATPVTVDSVQSVALSAGAATAVNGTRTPLTAADKTSFFEAGNATPADDAFPPDDAFDRKVRSLSYTDQTRIIAP